MSRQRLVLGMFEGDKVVVVVVTEYWCGGAVMG